MTFLPFGALAIISPLLLSFLPIFPSQDINFGSIFLGSSALVGAGVFTIGWGFEVVVEVELVFVLLVVVVVGVTGTSGSDINLIAKSEFWIWAWVENVPLFKSEILPKPVLRYE